MIGSDTMIFSGRNLVKYPYSRYGYTRGGGKTWHGGIDVCGIDDDKIRMPGYNGKSIAGTVVTARIVTNKSNKTWEWGYYICVKLDANQTPDAVNYLYFCHCSKLLASVGQKVKTGDVLAVVGQTGNAAGTWTHCHFEVRATATSKGLDPSAYAAIPNNAGIYGTAPAAEKPVEVPVSSNEKTAVSALHIRNKRNKRLLFALPYIAASRKPQKTPLQLHSATTAALFLPFKL